MFFSVSGWCHVQFQQFFGNGIPSTRDFPPVDENPHFETKFVFFATSMPFLFEPNKISRDSLIHCKKFTFPQNPRTNEKVGGAFKYFFVFTPNPGDMIQFDEI